RFSVLGSRFLVSGFRFCIGGCGVLGEPTEQALFELVRIGADGAAVICARDLPENCLGIAGVDETRVTQRNIAIDVSVDGQNWDSRGGEGAAVICARDLPENCLGIAGVDETRVTQRNIAIDVSVDGQNWDSRGGDGIFWRNLLHVEVIFPANIEESKFNDGPEEGASKPRTEVKGL